MNKSTRLIHDMSQLLNDMRVNHAGPKLWLLSANQLEEYWGFQQEQSERIQQHERANGLGSYFEAVLDGIIKHEKLPFHLKRALEISEPPDIPITATVSEAQEIWEQYRKGEGS